MYKVIYEATFKTPTKSVSFVFDSHRQTNKKHLIPYNYSITHSLTNNGYTLHILGVNSASCGDLKSFINYSQGFIMDYIEEAFQNTSKISLYITHTYYVKTTEEYMYLCNLSKLNSFLLYEDGWYGEGSLEIDESIINKVKRLLSTFSKQPEVFPLADGGIQIEWEEDNKYLEVQVLLENQVEIYSQYDGNEEEWKGNYDVERIYEEFVRVLEIS